MLHHTFLNICINALFDSQRRWTFSNWYFKKNSTDDLWPIRAKNKRKLLGHHFQLNFRRKTLYICKSWQTFQPKKNNTSTLTSPVINHQENDSTFKETTSEDLQLAIGQVQDSYKTQDTISDIFIQIPFPAKCSWTGENYWTAPWDSTAWAIWPLPLFLDTKEFTFYSFCHKITKKYGNYRDSQLF